VTASDRVARAVAELRPLPEVVRNIMETVADDDGTLDALLACVRTDSTLSALILGVVAKSGHNLTGEASDLSGAVAYFGIRNLTRVTVAQCLISNYRSVVGDGVDASVFWQHSIASGIAAELLAERTCLVSPGAAFAAGLLHNIGRPLLERLYDLRGPAAQQALDSNDSLHQIEAAITGMHHGTAGRMVANRWRLPRRFTEVIEFSHEDSGAMTGELCAITHAAHLMVLQMGLGIGIEGLRHTGSASALALLQLRIDDLDLLRAVLVTELKRAHYLVTQVARTN